MIKSNSKIDENDLHTVIFKMMVNLENNEYIEKTNLRCPVCYHKEMGKEFLEKLIDTWSLVNVNRTF